MPCSPQRRRSYLTPFCSRRQPVNRPPSRRAARCQCRWHARPSRATCVRGRSPDRTLRSHPARVSAIVPGQVDAPPIARRVFRTTRRTSGQSAGASTAGASSGYSPTTIVGSAGRSPELASRSRSVSTRSPSRPEHPAHAVLETRLNADAQADAVEVCPRMRVEAWHQLVREPRLLAVPRMSVKGRRALPRPSSRRPFRECGSREDRGESAATRDVMKQGHPLRHPRTMHRRCDRPSGRSVAIRLAPPPSRCGNLMWQRTVVSRFNRVVDG